MLHVAAPHLPALMMYILEVAIFTHNVQRMQLTHGDVRKVTKSDRCRTTL